MAARTPFSSLVSFALLLLCRSFNGSTATADVASKLGFDSIYQFGDSISDTGNLMRETSLSFCSHSPYGETTFGKPTGRCSDGLLIVDYFAKAFNLPLLNPYLQSNANFTHGVNFAVAGATALNASEDRLLSTRSSLNVQLGWFQTHLKSACSSTSHCKKKLKRALFLMGEIGGNDYNFALFGNKSLEDVRNMVPDIVQAITDAVEEVISHGALHVVVPGNFPIGCMPVYLNRFGSNDTTMYDNIGCLKQMNEFSRFHNKRLQRAIKKLQRQHPSVNIYYGDYYFGSTWVLRNAVSLGFEKDGLFKPCCGDKHRQCGVWNEVPLCPDPSKRISWDGTHPTQEAYRNLAGWLLSHTFTLDSTPSPAPAPDATPAPDASVALMISMEVVRVLMVSILASWAIGSQLL